MTAPYRIDRKANELHVGDRIIDGAGVHVATFLAYGHDGYMVFAVETETWLGFPKAEGNVYVSRDLWGNSPLFPETLTVEVIA